MKLQQQRGLTMRDRGYDSEDTRELAGPRINAFTVLRCILWVLSLGICVIFSLVAVFATHTPYQALGYVLAIAVVYVLSRQMDELLKIFRDGK